MKTALVVQDSLGFLGGGELVCLTTCLALQSLGYHVKLVSDTFPTSEVEAVFGLGNVLERCEQVKVPTLGRKLARLSSLPGLLLSQRSKRFLERQHADIVFVTRDPRRPDVLPDEHLFRFMYELSQLDPYWRAYKYTGRLYDAMYESRRASTSFLALSPKLVEQLKARGHLSTRLVYPSIGKGYHHQQKKNQVIYVTFLAPQKRIQDFTYIASQLPSLQFYLVGRDTERINRIYHGYAAAILANLPNNVHYVETRIRQQPDLLEQSKVYLHASTEPGMGIAVIEALSAGCLPIAPHEGGAGEVIAAAGVGLCYNSLEEAVECVRVAARGEDRKSQFSPEEIALKSRIFSQEAFQSRIRNIIEEKPSIQ